jgi:ubiquinone/menaquinone biosynthesis C-methylase UbiE
LVPLLENPYFETVAGAEKLMDRAGVEPGMTALDAGCGPGRVSLPLARAVGREGRVVAFDLQEGMLAKLRARADEQGLGNIEPVHGGLGEGVVPRAGFDVAFLITVLGEIPDPVAALQEIREALRPGGILSITEVLPDPHYQSLARVRELAARVGLEEAQLFDGTIGFTINLRRPD